MTGYVPDVRDGSNLYRDITVWNNVRSLHHCTTSGGNKPALELRNRNQNDGHHSAAALTRSPKPTQSSWASAAGEQLRDIRVNVYSPRQPTIHPSQPRPQQPAARMVSRRVVSSNGACNSQPLRVKTRKTPFQLRVGAEAHTIDQMPSFLRGLTETEDSVFCAVGTTYLTRKLLWRWSSLQLQPAKPPNCAADLGNLSLGIVETDAWSSNVGQPRQNMPSLNKPTPLPVGWPIGSHPHCVPRRMQSFPTGGLAGWCWWPSH